VADSDKLFILFDNVLIITANIGTCQSNAKIKDK
jgi:hypothetical protein